MQFKFISWNIWGGKNRDQVVSFLQNTPFDILALQEVTVRDNQGNLENDALIIAEKLGYHVTYATAFRTDRHETVYDLGNAIISKYPIEKTQVHELSDLSQYEKNSTTEPRNAVQADIRGEDGTVIHVISTHLGYSQDLQATPLQTYQLNKLLELVPREKTVLMGDFNSEPTSTIIQRLSEEFVVLNHLTNPSWTNFKNPSHPQHRIDYIFTTHDIHTHSFSIENSQASDHFPLFATLEV